jgi:hypothetical protein
MCGKHFPAQARACRNARLLHVADDVCESLLHKLPALTRQMRSTQDTAAARQAFYAPQSRNPNATADSFFYRAEPRSLVQISPLRNVNRRGKLKVAISR